MGSMVYPKTALLLQEKPMGMLLGSYLPIFGYSHVSATFMKRWPLKPLEAGESHHGTDDVAAITVFLLNHMA